MEKRIADSEDRMSLVMTFIKDNDLSHRPKIIGGYPEYAAKVSSLPPYGDNYLIRPQMDGIGGLGSQESLPSPNGNMIAESLRSNVGGEEYFRSTNFFASHI